MTVKIPYTYAAHVPYDQRISIAQQIVAAKFKDQTVEFADHNNGVENETPEITFIYHMLLAERMDNNMLKEKLEEKNKKMKEISKQLSEFKKSK
jgi:hypothetical protein